jgi:hypothetical protein
MSNKTSFIPKTPFLKADKLDYRRAGLGFILKASIVLFVISLTFFVGVWVYKEIVNRQIEELSISLGRARAVFDPISISEIEELSLSIPIAKGLLSQHLLPSRIFDILEDLTLKEIRFTSFDYAYKPVQKDNILGPFRQNDIPAAITVVLNGEAKNYMALAQQSEVLKRSAKISEFSFSNFNLTPDGNVSFALKIIFDNEL